jgi:hypothetical protein
MKKMTMKDLYGKGLVKRKAGSVLTQQELAGLLKVPTAVAQAKQIRKRNIALLRAIKRGVAWRGEVGCPHCQVVGENECDTCAWSKHPASKMNARLFGKPYENNIFGVCCLGVTFGGIPMRAVQGCGIEYAADWESFDPIKYHDNYSGSIERAIRGHIEWANEVIRRGGVR